MTDHGLIFISYAREDKAFAYQLQKDLEDHEKNVWIDRKLKKGQLWANEIRKQLREASQVYVVMSPAAQEDRRFVAAEVDYAFKHKTVVPVLCRQCDLEPPYNGYQWIDCTTLKKYEANLPELITGEKGLPPIKKPWYLRFLIWHRKATALAIAAVLIALSLSAYYYWFSPSKTSVMLGQTNDGSTISLFLQNRGGQSSTNLGGYRLTFGDLPIVEAKLDVIKAPVVVHGHSTPAIVLQTRAGFEPKQLPDGSYRNDNEIEKLLPGHDVVLAVDVKESSDSESHPRIARFPASRISRFIIDHYPHTVPGGNHAH